MSHKQSLLGVGMFYTREEALTLLRNMSDFEDESISESENKGDSSDSSEYAPEQQYQVRTDSNIQTVLPKETANQNATKLALLADETATTSGEEHVASPPKVSKAKEIPKKGQKAEPKLVARKRVIPQMVMASNNDMDVEDYYIVEDDNESASSEYVPCVNSQMIKYIQKMKRMVGLGLSKILVPQIFIDLRDLVKTT